MGLRPADGLGLRVIDPCPGGPGDAFAPPSEGWQASSARYEIKFTGLARRADEMEALLRAHCPPDGAHPENVVHSVYYDTHGLAAYGEKADGQYVKTKLRLRWYEPFGGAAWLEIKAKRGSLGAKHRKRIACSAPPPRDSAALAQVAREHLGVALQPTIWLAYRRLRFVAPDGSARVSLDRDIRVVWASPALPRRERPGALATFVVEVKGDAPEPSASLLGLVGRCARRGAFSKYAACVDRVRGGPA
jgi:hypothetical protein